MKCTITCTLQLPAMLAHFKTKSTSTFIEKLLETMLAEMLADQAKAKSPGAQGSTV